MHIITDKNFRDQYTQLPEDKQEAVDDAIVYLICGGGLVAVIGIIAVVITNLFF